MSRSGEAIAGLLNEWRELQDSRPSEGDFTSFGYDGVNYAVMSTQFERWRTIIATLDEKNAWHAIPELALADHGISAAILKICELVARSKAEGVRFMMTNGLVKAAFETSDHILGLTARRVSVARALGKAMAGEEEACAERIIAAAQTITDLAERREKATADSEDIVSVKDKVHQLLAHIADAQTTAEVSSTTMQVLYGAAESSAATARQAEIDSTKSQKEIVALKASAIEREAELEARVLELNAKIAAADEAAQSAKEQVQKALKLARSQGLAGSFQDRSKRLGVERWIWTIGFIVAAVGLFIVGITFVQDIPELRYEYFFVALLKKLALVGPLVWLGWYCARQVSRVAKIQEDYEYKAASALAYQSYRDEAAVGSDESLRVQLLTRAITTFGENPVRLYDGPKAEVHSPLEDLISKIKPERALEIVLNLAKGSGK